MALQERGLRSASIASPSQVPSSCTTMTSASVLRPCSIRPLANDAANVKLERKLGTTSIKGELPSRFRGLKPHSCYYNAGCTHPKFRQRAQRSFNPLCLGPEQRFPDTSISSPDRSPKPTLDQTFNQQRLPFHRSKATTAGSDYSPHDFSSQPGSQDTTSQNLRTLSSFLGTVFTASETPAFASDQASQSSGGEPVHTAVLLMAAAVLAAMGWALRGQWKNVLERIQSGVQYVQRKLSRAPQKETKRYTVDIGAATYSIPCSLRPHALLERLQKRGLSDESQLKEDLHVYNLDADVSVDVSDEARSWGPSWGQKAATRQPDFETETAQVLSNERGRIVPGLGRCIGRFTLSDEPAGLSESAEVFQRETGDLVLDSGEDLGAVRVIGEWQRRLIEKATPEMSDEERERLIENVWEPGVRDGALLARALQAYDRRAERGQLADTGKSVGGLFDRLLDWSRKQRSEARKQRNEAEARAARAGLSRLGADDLSSAAEGVQAFYRKEFDARRSDRSDAAALLARSNKQMLEEIKFAMRNGENGKVGRIKPGKKWDSIRKKDVAELFAAYGGGGDGEGSGGGGWPFGGRGSARDEESEASEDPFAWEDWGEVWEKRVEAYANDLKQEVVAPGDIDVSFESLPYPLDEGTRWALASTAKLHLKRGQFANFVDGLPSLSPRVLLTGPTGSERYQEAVAKAMARECGARFLCFDHARLWRVQEKFGLYDHLRHFTTATESGDNADVSDRPVVIQMGGGSDIMKQPLIEMNGKLGTPASFARLLSLEAKGGDSTGELSDPRKKVDLPVMVGDRVRYKGFSDLDDYKAGKKPRRNSVGRVESISDSGVKATFGAHDIEEEVKTYDCKARDLEVVSPHDDFTRMVTSALYQVVKSESKKGPFVLFFRGLTEWLTEVPADARKDRFHHLLDGFEDSEENVMFVGSHTHAVEKKEKPDLGGPQMEVMLESILGARPTPIGDKELRVPPQLLTLFPSQVALKMPEDAVQVTEWKRQMEADKKAMLAEANAHQLNKVLASSRLTSTAICSKLSYSQRLLTPEQAQRVVAWAAAHVLTSDLTSEPEVADGMLVLPLASVEYALSMLDKVERKKEDGVVDELPDVELDNEYEKSLMTEVIPPSDVGVKFDDIGALDPVKDTLRELVMLPLQRPELFKKGQLTKPAKGVLLFGPPGTGKTMLAKAVATEAGANFINVSLSSISSKWFGEAEKLVKAIFTLASKISPTVIFIDEVDSLLGARGSGGEHEATRKMKNEFMACWDGLKTKSTERVLVLAATNRPFDLDDAVIRRMPRRLMVDLPDKDNRAKILSVILREEELAADVNMDELAAQTEGYSGSDLKNLCVAAAYEPIREILAQEKKRQDAEKTRSEGAAAGSEEVGPSGHEAAQPEVVLPVIRPMRMDDFMKAKETVGASVSQDAASINDLKKWNEEFGEGGNRKKRSLGFNLDHSLS